MVLGNYGEGGKYMHFTWSTPFLTPGDSDKGSTLHVLATKGAETALLEIHPIPAGVATSESPKCPEQVVTWKSFIRRCSFFCSSFCAHLGRRPRVGRAAYFFSRWP